MIALLLLLAQDVTADAAALDEEARWTAICEAAIPKTVRVEFGMGGETSAPAGSGALVSADGLVVTCAHVVEAAAQPQLAFGNPFDGRLFVRTADGTRYEARALGRCSTNDFALLDVEGDEFPHFDLAAFRRPGEGERVIALGFPVGNIGTVPHGGGEPDGCLHASVALGQVVQASTAFAFPDTNGVKFYPDAIETDAPIFFGNSGGPLVDGRGELVGLNGAIIGPAQRSFTLSAGSIAGSFDRLRAGENPEGVDPDWQTALGNTAGIFWDAARHTLDRSTGIRPYLEAPFAEVVRSRREGVVRLLRGESAVGYATILDGEGRAAAPLRVVDPRSLAARARNWVREQFGDDLSGWLDLEPEPLVAEFADGRRVPVAEDARLEDLGIAVLRLQGDHLPAPIPPGDERDVRAGQWVVMVGTGERPLGVGVLSARVHTVHSATRMPLGLRDAAESWWGSPDDFTPRDYDEVLLHDVPLSLDHEGSAVVDSHGRLLGVNLYHPSRGTTYAVGIDRILGALGVR